MRLKKLIQLWAPPLRRLPDLPEPKINPGFGRWTGQWPLPPGPWATCLLLGARGSGKSVGGINWLLDQVEQIPGEQLAIVAPTKSDLWGTCIYHPHTGILAWARPNFPLKVEKTAGQIVCTSNGAIIRLLSGEKPERLRVANNLGKVLVEELGALQRPEKVWEVLKFSVRAGTLPQVVFTSNPKRGLNLIRELMESPTGALVQTNSFQNPNLPTAFLRDTIIPAMNDPRARETVWGEQLEESPGALFSRDHFKRISGADVMALDFKRIE